MSRSDARINAAHDQMRVGNLHSVFVFEGGSQFGMFLTEVFYALGRRRLQDKGRWSVPVLGAMTVCS